MTELERLKSENEALRRLVINADEVARRRGDEFGLCDCIDNFGNPYPSQWSHDIIAEARESGMVTLTLDDARFWQLVKPTK